ncbi:hypothetical protein MTP99_015790 [Tenebrio molitor]|nr:hypothetical protein MTP99_015790 [Tenebrio molitor]
MYLTAVFLLNEVFSESNHTVDGELFCKGLQLAKEIVTRAVCLARPDERGACFEVVSDLKKVLLGAVYNSSSILPSSSIKNVFNVFCSYLGESNDPNALYLTYFNDVTITEDGFFDELKVLLPVLGGWAKEGQHFTSYKIVDHL